MLPLQMINEGTVWNGAQHWIATSYDFAVAASFASEKCGSEMPRVLAIHTNKDRALWASSTFLERQDDPSSYHEREIMLRVTGKKLEYTGQQCITCGILKSEKFKNRKDIDVVAVKLVDAKPTKTEASSK